MKSSSPDPLAPEDLLPSIQPGLVSALTSAYSTLLKRQRTASAAFVRWSTANSRSHEFAWLPEGKEQVLFTGKEIRIGPDHPSYAALNKMMATIQLNPYEKDLFYGYPYVIGKTDETTIRAPLLTIPITITSEADTLIVKPNEDIVRFNSLAFRSEMDSAAHELALGRLIEATPSFPLTIPTLVTFCQNVVREMGVKMKEPINGSIRRAPSQPRGECPLEIHSVAATFIAPKTGYFLTADLEKIGREGDEKVRHTSLGWLIGKRGCQPTSNAFNDSKNVCFPFSSNANQRRLALLTNDPSVHIAICHGPPGTGKSLTIANLACHLVAMGKRVLICSHKDKALQVVDELLRSLCLSELPMTLLRHDQDSKRELRQRLEAIDKVKSSTETQRDTERETARFRQMAVETMQVEANLAEALHAEHTVAQASQSLRHALTFLRRVRLKWGLWEARRTAKHRSSQHSDHYGNEATTKRADLLMAAVKMLRSAAAHRTGSATRQERNNLAEFSKLLGRNQSSTKNIPVFDRLKNDPERCHALLKILPCWIMTPDDVARLFPLEAGLFDYCIFDESSQIDLPSAVPVLYRSKCAVIAGDPKQMKAMRFSFSNTQVAAQAWREYKLDQFDPDHWLDPSGSDLLQLGLIRADETVLLNEHFRSLPGIIGFSNTRWYGDQLRMMRDEDDRRVGPPNEPYIQLVQVKEGFVQPGTQENEQEARQLVAKLKQFLVDPAYADASFGVLALFEEQVRLLNELIAEHIPEELRTEHDLIVSNPDGVQGDERDIIFYSLSYDANGMEQAQLSARQAEREHIQGMLNVAFTRAREGMVIFHSAALDEFGMASGKGAIREWLEHCERASSQAGSKLHNQSAYTQSEFEAEVLQALSAKNISTISQFPACGFYIDIVATQNDKRLAIECDGEAYHLDEHGRLKQEDILRQEILERAGWRVIRISYRAWEKSPHQCIKTVLDAFQEPDEEPDDIQSDADNIPPQGGSLKLSTYEAAIIHALRMDEKDREMVLRAARIYLKYGRLSKSLRHALENAISVLVDRRVILLEDGELFPTEQARHASIITYHSPRPASQTSADTQYRRYKRRYSRYRRS